MATSKAKLSRATTRTPRLGKGSILEENISPRTPTCKPALARKHVQNAQTPNSKSRCSLPAVRKLSFESPVASKAVNQKTCLPARQSVVQNVSHSAEELKRARPTIQAVTPDLKVIPPSSTSSCNRGSETLDKEIRMRQELANLFKSPRVQQKLAAVRQRKNTFCGLRSTGDASPCGVVASETHRPPCGFSKTDTFEEVSVRKALVEVKSNETELAEWLRKHEEQRLKWIRRRLENGFSVPKNWLLLKL